MNVSFIVPCRNKAQHVAKTVRSVLAQSYSPMEIVLSDQGSEDKTLDILRDLADGYDGPNEVRVLQCPDTEYRGHAGINAHLNWLHQQITGDIVIMCAADDLNHHDRAKHVVAAFETAYQTNPAYLAALDLYTRPAGCRALSEPAIDPEHYRPSYVGTRVRYIDPDGQPMGETRFPERRSRWVGAAEAFRHMIGSSASSAWARDLYEKHGPLRGIEAQDMILPPLALCERGLYYVDLPLHSYIAHASLDNAGMEGQVRAARDDVERAQLTEVNNFHNVHHWTNVAKRIENAGLMHKLDAAARGEMMKRIAVSAELFAQVREILTMQRIDPVPMKV